MSLNSKLVAQVLADYTDPLDLSTPKDSLNFDKRLRLTSGTGADQADIVWHDQRTIASSSNDDLDLAGALSDAFGSTVTFARVKALLVAADSANGDTLAVGGEGTNPFASWAGSGTDTVIVRPGGVLALYAPDATAYTVTASTDILRVANNDASNSSTYDIIVIGATA